MSEEKRYEWVPGSPFHGDANEVGRELERIHKTGGLTPQDIVIQARPVCSPLHPQIYDGTTADEALQAYHLARARSLIKSLIVRVVEQEEKEIKVNGFHRVVKENGDRDWVPAVEVKANPLYNDQVERRLIREMRSLKKQLDQWQVYQSVSIVIEEALSA